MIKPGSICYLVNVPLYPEHAGKVLTVVAKSFVRPSSWEVSAEWLTLAYPGEIGIADSNQLIPIDDPDEPVTTHTPEALTA